MNEIKYTDMDVTPEMAYAWLTEPQFDAPNRTMRRRKLAAYATAMREGRWRMTGEAIKFSTEGKLLDGQHRLTAVVDAGVTVRLTIATGVEASAQDVMDTGAARTASDVLAIHGMPSAGSVSAAARVVLAIERGLRGPEMGNVRIGNDEILEYVQKHDLIMQLQSGHSSTLRKIPANGSITLAAFVFMAQQDHDGAVEFMSRLAAGTNLSEGSAILACREKLNTIRSNRERHPASVMLSLIFRCFNAWTKGQEMVRPKLYSRGGESIPMPVKLGRG